MKIREIEVLVVKGDITEVDTEVIVNAANTHFQMGGGVAGAIKRKGGRVIEEEAQKQGPVEVGEAVLTSAGNLGAKYVIHAVTMRLDFKTDEEIVRKAAYNTLLCAQKHKITSLAFCALGCGVGRFPYEAASKIMAQEIFRYLRESKAPTLKKIVFALYSQAAYEIFQKNIDSYLEYMVGKVSQGPFVTVDGIVEYRQGIVMIERSNPPFGWALPGGFLDYGESLESAVAREIKEETGLEFVDFKQFKTYSEPDRDPRFHTVSVVFTGCGQGELVAASDAKSAKVFELNSLPQNLAFDHGEIIRDYMRCRALSKK